jgi:hypothetical protein
VEFKRHVVEHQLGSFAMAEALADVGDLEMHGSLFS